MTRRIGAVAIALGMVGCGPNTEPASCGPCGDGSIVCTDTVEACLAENSGVCTTKIGATSAPTLNLHADGCSR